MNCTLTSAQSPYSIREFKKNFKKQILLAFYVTVPGSAVVEKESIYVLFADPETFRPTISFFSLIDPPSQDAEGIFSAINKAFADEGLEQLLKNIVFLASDG